VTSRALVGLALLAGFVMGQIADTLKPSLEPAESTFRADTVSRYRPAKSAGTAVLLSFLLPGGGQVYTGNWWKAAAIAPAEATLGYFSVREHVVATNALHKGDSTAYAQYRDRRTVLVWWTGAVLAFSMADAYVSAQMYGFDREMSLSLGPMRAGITVGF
jgi:hypothetical protein